MPTLINTNLNTLLPGDLAVHDRYRFVLSFPPHPVREYRGRFGAHGRTRVQEQGRVARGEEGAGSSNTRTVYSEDEDDHRVRGNEGGGPGTQMARERKEVGSGSRYGRPIESIFLAHFTEGMVEFEFHLAREKHCRLVPPDQLSPGELQRYATQGSAEV